MRRSMTIAAAVALSACTTIWAAPAHAALNDGFACELIDSSAAVGSSIVYTVPDDCEMVDIRVRGGAPTLSDVPGSQSRLVWQQQVERATGGATCSEGWGPTWAQWARGGLGGPTCVREIDWGAGLRTTRVVSVTINTASDWVELISEASDLIFSQWATGCAVTNTTVLPDSFYFDHRLYGCN